ncbi:hypothetical protein [Luteitalea sp. TBR-22]|uniref:hypothetical protein n=1 Tax=Luteitalea sp. TBR-22 TaxID=2802971 RepID=UPI001EF562CB|nr:hypothetical protein [Luteitalea sp. TBR-22]
MNARHLLLTLGASLLLAPGLLAQPADEPPPTVGASSILSATELRGPHHTVEERVATPGFFHEFTITSEFGTFTALGKRELTRYVREINALYELSQVSKSDIFIEAAGQSLVNVAKGATNAVTKPVDTAKGVGSGLKRMGTNLGRRSKRAVDEMGDDDPELSEEEKKAQGSGATNAAYGVLGVNSAVRKWAAKVQVDPYTTNLTLKQALEGIAKVDAAGSLTTKFVVPIPPLVGPAATVGNLVWSTDPEELRKINEARARELGVTSDDAKKFFLNNRLTLTMQTRLLAALHAVKPGNAADFITTVTGARSEREALFFIHSAEMLQELHARSPVKAVLTDSRALVAVTRTGEGVALLPVDWLRETKTAVATMTEAAARARKELGATTLRLQTEAHLTERAKAAFSAAGWTI